MVDPDDDVQAFYREAYDGVQAFEYRLRNVLAPSARREADYLSLLQALEAIPSPTAMVIVTRERDALLKLTRSHGPGGVGWAAFMNKLHALARRAGDVDLAAYAACASARALLVSTPAAPETYRAAKKMAGVYRDDTSCSQGARAEAALVLGEIALDLGELRTALREARRALQLSVAPEVSARCFLLAGDADMSRGSYRAAARNYQLAAVRVGTQTRLARDALLRKALAECKRGFAARALPPMKEMLSSITTDDYPTVSLVLLEIGKRTGSDLVTQAVGSMRDLSGRALGRWRDCCRLSLGIAEVMVEAGRNDQAAGQLDYVLRMAGQFGNRPDAATAFSLLARASWSDGRMRDVLSAVRGVRRLVWPLRSGAVFGWSELLRARVAFYSGRLADALLRSTDALATFDRAGAQMELCRAAETIAATMLWAGKIAKGVEFLTTSSGWLKSATEPLSLTRSQTLLCSACHCSDDTGMAERALGTARGLRQLPQGPADRLLHSLLQCDVACMGNEGGAAVRSAEKAVEQAAGLRHRILEAIAYYQLVKALCTASQRSEAENVLAKARSEYPFGEKMMWRDAASELRGPMAGAVKFKPFAAFPF
ncbi:hypothetical protein ACFL09_00185 [Planctomycetota bacterium]